MPSRDRLTFPVPLTRWTVEASKELHRQAHLPAPDAYAGFMLKMRWLFWSRAGRAFRQRNVSAETRFYAREIISGVRDWWRATLAEDYQAYRLAETRVGWARSLQMASAAAGTRTRIAREHRHEDTQDLKARALDRAAEIRKQNRALTDTDVATALNHEFPDRAVRTYRRWISEG